MRGWTHVSAAAFGAVAMCISVPATAATPSLRENADEAEIEDWIAAEVDPGDEMRGVLYDDAIEYYDPRRLEKLPDGHLIAYIRREFWRPRREGRATWRSERQKVELDCQAYRFRFLSIDSYADNNLKGRLVPRPLDQDWYDPPPEDSSDGQEVRQACSFASLIGSADWTKAMPPPPAEEAAFLGWAAQHIEPGDRSLLTSDGGTLYYFSPQDIEKTKEGWIKVRLREEFAFPVVVKATAMRSALTTYEFDCERHEYRTSDHVAFPGANLLGTPYGELDEDDLWTMAVAGDVDARLGRALCRLSAAPGTSVEEALKPEAPPPPATMDIAGVRAWVDRYVNLNDYALVRPNDIGLTLYSPNSLTLLPNGNVKAIARTEAFRPQVGEDFSIRSVLFELEFDCRRPRYRMTKMIAYDHQNLEGAVHTLEGAEWRPFEPSSDNAALSSQFCAQRELLAPGIDRDVALIPNPRSTDDADIETWLDRYIDPRDGTYAGHTDGVAGLFSAAEGERTRQDHIRVWTRMEFFDPVVDKGLVTRSGRALQEFDCTEGRTRVLATEAYPGANLTGKKREHSVADAQWTFIRPRSLESMFADAVCELKDAVDAEAAERMSEPQLPERDSKTPL